MVGWARREKEEQEEELFGDYAFLRVPDLFPLSLSHFGMHVRFSPHNSPQ